MTTRHKAARRTHEMLVRLMDGECLTLHRVCRDYEVSKWTARRYFRVIEDVHDVETFTRNDTKFWRYSKPTANRAK